MSQQWQVNTGDRGAQRHDLPLRICPACNRSISSDDAHADNCPHGGASVSGEFQATEQLFDGRYKILAVIASGGMGTVYRAVHRSLSKPVAIKMLRAQNTSQVIWARFQQEARTASMLTHPNIIHIDDFGATSDGQPYMVMDFIEGPDLAGLIQKEKQVPAPEAIAIILQVCSAMQHAHARGVLHRDLKPSNIMLSNPNGLYQVKIVDFGIAKFINPGEMQSLTQTGEIFGSPFYMSPEQVLGKALDARSDIYSLGCIMYEALTGDVPFFGKTAFETMMKHTNERPELIQDRAPRANFSDELQFAVMKCLEKEQSHRFQTMGELAQALNETPEILGRQAKTLKLGRTAIGVNINASTRRKSLKILGITGAFLFLGALVYLVFFHNFAAKPGDDSGGPFAGLRKAVSNPSTIVTSFQSTVNVRQVKPTPANNARPVRLTNIKDSQDLHNEIEDVVRIYPNTSEVIIAGCALNDDHLRQLKNLNLRALAILDSADLSDDGLKVLSEFPHLQILSINESRTDKREDSYMTNTKVTDDCFDTLSTLKELRVLELCGQLSVTGKKLASLPLSLKHLDLSYDQRLDPEAIKDLNRLHDLKTLVLARTAVNDRSVESLKSLKLQALDLRAAPISDSSLQALQHMPLTTLGLHDTNVGPKSLPVLCSMTTLQVLDLGNANLSKEEKREIKDANPNIQMKDINLQLNIKRVN